MGYDHTNKSFTVKAISQDCASGKAKFDNIIQRGYVWSPEQKSLLIHSAAIQVPIPDLYAQVKTEGKTKYYDILDGKQRMNTLYQYLNDMFSLRTVPEVTYVNRETNKEETIDISGKRFSELPESLQDIISERTVNMVLFDSMSKKESVELFIRLNNGKALSSDAKAIANCADIDHMFEIGQHPIFTSILSQKAREGKKEIVLIVKTYFMLTKPIDDISFLSKAFHPQLKETVISAADEKTIRKVYDYAEKTRGLLIDGGKKRLANKIFKREVHFISLIPLFYQAIDDKVKPEKFVEWMTYFFDGNDGGTVSMPYNEASSNAVAQPHNIQTRNAELVRSYNKDLKKK